MHEQELGTTPSEWNFEGIEGDVRVTHWHADGKRHTARHEVQPDGRRRAQCDDCGAVEVVDPVTEDRLIADPSTDALADGGVEGPSMRP